jgi:hypothetical protein
MILLPNKNRWIGWMLVIAGLAGTLAYLLTDFRITLPVFALYSGFLESKFFTVYQSNVADELILILLLAGLFMVTFSGEKKEDDRIAGIRSVAWRRAIMTNSILLALSILLVYGNGFLAVLVVNLFSLHITYLLFFTFLRRRG